MGHLPAYGAVRISQRKLQISGIAPPTGWRIRRANDGRVRGICVGDLFIVKQEWSTNEHRATACHGERQAPDSAARVLEKADPFARSAAILCGMIPNGERSVGGLHIG